MKIGDKVQLVDCHINGVAISSTREYARLHGFEFDKTYVIQKWGGYMVDVVYLEGVRIGINVARLKLADEGDPW